MNLQRNILCLVLMLAGFCFYPGLKGGFIFDDAASLSQLGDTGGIESLTELQQYVFGGNTGPGGRPLALLTFAINAQTWPASPLPFLLTNILIHLFNGLLIFAFMRKLLADVKHGESLVTTFLPIVATAIWLCHPIHISSVLYVVQRMTTLAATFAIATFIIYLEFRKALLLGLYRRCSMLTLAGGVLFLLGFFTKETALLLPIQLLIIEIFCGVLRQDATQLPIKNLRKYVVYPAAAVFLVYPLWLLSANAYHYWQQGAEPETGRPFTMFQRLYTEGRILGDYIYTILLPRSQTAGVFNDGYVISTSLFNPLTTFYWWLTHIGLILTATLLRARFPLIFFGVLWFYVNHILESTVFMLELKFEHRNYLAVLGWAVLVGYVLLAIKISRVYRWVLGCVYMCLLATLLFLGARLWGNPPQSSLVWVENNPNSPRALDYAASIFVDRQESTALALSLIRRAATLSPQDPTFEIKYVWYGCGTHPAGSIDWDGIAKRLQTAPLNWSLHATLRNLLNSAAAGHCPELSLDSYLKLIAAVRQNPAYAKSRVPVLLAEEEVLACFVFGRPEQGLATFSQQNFLKVPLNVTAQQALVIASHGYRQEAATYLEKSLSLQRNDPKIDAFSLEQFEEILRLIKADIANNPTNKGS